MQPAWMGASRLAGGRSARYCYQAPPLPTDAVKLAALRAAFPDFVFAVVTINGRRCFGAVRAAGDGPLLSVACVSATELWRILRKHR